MIIFGGSKELRRVIVQLANEWALSLDQKLESIKSVIDLSNKVKTLRDEIEMLTIEKSRKQEEFDKKNREIDHKLGLAQARQTQELELAKREAKLEVNEANLKTEREAFGKQMEFNTNRFTAECKYLKEIISNLAKQLPTMHIERKIGR